MMWSFASRASVFDHDDDFRVTSSSSFHLESRSLLFLYNDHSESRRRRSGRDYHDKFKFTSPRDSESHCQPEWQARAPPSHGHRDSGSEAGIMIGPGRLLLPDHSSLVRWTPCSHRGLPTGV